MYQLNNMNELIGWFNFPLGSKYYINRDSGNIITKHVKIQI